MFVFISLKEVPVMLYEVWYDTDVEDELFAGSFDTREEAELEAEFLKDEFGNIPVRIVELIVIK
jgi:hypothetical protein